MAVKYTDGSNILDDKANHKQQNSNRVDLSLDIMWIIGVFAAISLCTT